MSTMSSTKTEHVARASLAGAIIAALAASACCILPAILAIVGISGVGLAAALEPYRPFLLGGTAVLLGVGFYLTYRKPRGGVAEATGEPPDACGCEKPKIARRGKAMLWIATALTVAFAAYPYIAGAFATSSAKGTATATHTATARFTVENMDCRACTTQIVRALVKQDGVVDAKVDYDGGFAVVTYDPLRVNPQTLASVISKLGYPAKIQPTRELM